MVDLPAESLVVGDVVELRSGEQVGADSVVAEGQAEVDESLVTGESDPVSRVTGDPLISGTGLVSGSLVATVTAVGADSYAGRLADEVRRYSLTGSELMGSINRVLRWLSVLIVIVAPVLLWRQLQIEDWRAAVRSTTAGLVGMVPEGLVLLTTLAFFTAATRLGRRGVLVQELPAVEILARVDALCTDKTGTLTQGGITMGGLILPTKPDPGQGSGLTRAEVEAALAAMAADQDGNATMAAIRDAFPIPPGWDISESVAFNSMRKWSAATLAGRGTWVLGASEMVTAADPHAMRNIVADLAAKGSRVLVVAHGHQPLLGSNLPPDLELVAVVHLRERLRPDARATLDYFAAQGVTVRVVSGDSAPTVGALAGAVGLAGAADPIDARSLPQDTNELDQLVRTHRVFGRVTPEQKQAIVGSLHRQGHVIAMTGDGVNDILALKDADLGIAMGSGTAVARGVAQLVLLDDQFDTLPFVVAQGRQVLHNIERVASLFLVKNVYSLIISVSVAAAGWPYPFLPRHLALISAVAIGIPAFFLALAPNEEPFRPGFLPRVLRFSIPAGLIIATGTLAAYAAARADTSSRPQTQTAAIIVVMIASLWVLKLTAQPLRAWTAGLIVAMTTIFAAAFTIPGINTFFNLDHRPHPTVMIEAIAIGLATCAALSLPSRWARKSNRSA